MAMRFHKEPEPAALPVTVTTHASPFADPTAADPGWALETWPHRKQPDMADEPTGDDEGDGA